MTEKLQRIYKLISSIYAMDDIDRQALEQAKEDLAELIKEGEHARSN